MTEGWTRADRWRTELVRTAGAVPLDLVAEFGVALLDELAKRGTPHGALHPEVISVRHEGSALRVQIDPKSWPTNPTQEMALATGSKSMTARPGIHYRAPEQFTSRPEDVHDARMDCFAVGVMLYEIATGQLPFAQDAQQPFRVFLLLKRGGFPSLQQLRRDIPDALATAITSALALRADERTPDAATMASALRTLMRPPAPKVVPAPQVASRPAGEHAPEPPTPARPVPDRTAVPMDPLRPIETGVLPAATQAAIAAFRAGQAGQQAPLTGERPAVSATVRAPQPSPPKPPSGGFGGPSASPPIPLGPPVQPAPIVTPTAPATPTTPAPREVPLPIRAIVEAVTRPEPSVPAASRQPDLPVSAPIAAAPPSAPVTRQPIIMVPPRAAPPSKPVVVAPAPPAPRAPVEPVRERPPERTQVTGPPVMAESSRSSAPRTPTHSPSERGGASEGVGLPPVESLHIPLVVPERIPEPLRLSPAPAPRTLQPPAPPAQPTVIAPPPASLVRATAPSAWPPPDASLPAAPVQPSKPTAAPPRAPVSVPAPTVAPRPASVPAPAPVAVSEPSRDDTARKAAGEITPPEGSAKVPPASPTNRRAVVVLSGVLLLLGLGAGLLFQLPSRVADAPAAVPECTPGPEKICPPPEPVAMPDSTPVVCEQKPCAPPKPSPRLECFYDGYSKGQRLYLRGDRRGALEAFHAAEACMPKNPRLLQWLGRCYEELRERDQAREYYERYLRRRPRADDADYYRKRLDSLEHSNGGAPRDGGTR